MKKNIKYFVAVLGSFLVLITNVRAYEGPQGDDGSFDKDYYYSQEQVEARSELQSKVYNKPSTRSGSSRNLSVNGFEQETKYYCGPASVQIIMNYKRGIKPSQSSIASSMGTTTSGTNQDRMVTYLNKSENLGGNSYVKVSTGQIALSKGISYSIDSNYPVILNVQPETLPGYAGYTSSGHYIVGTGYSFGWSTGSSSETVTYFDPFRTANNPSSFGSKTVQYSTMLSAVNKKAGLYSMYGR
ncbi:C39 family peptidase [Anaerorhabdus furcosa]|uniref:Peptidase_C39 like family protein n=1 Tax=Anaerorhabdus furcosa TaxID=118967 RepID=A0A1T4PMK1_9FIRM|nr:C39 family peptidase [Anaerorhabdus furcosa]SJZ92138.1 Peptidase_C39 like family protein [Anaerorhabdus furcosa]